MYQSCTASVQIGDAVGYKENAKASATRLQRVLSLVVL